MSSNKTANLQLNQWQAGDAFLREEFNQDNAKIEEKLGPLISRGACVTGRFKVNCTANREIVLGFRPKFVMLWGIYISSDATGLIFADGAEAIYAGNHARDIVGLALTDRGFSMADFNYFNGQGGTTSYVAFY